MDKPEVSEAPCDYCGKVIPWEDLETGDDGETWICAPCQPCSK